MGPGWSTKNIRFRRHYSEYTPYLGLRSRLSQVWFNRWSLLLFLVFLRVLLSTNGLNTDMESARREALSSCTGVESMGSAMASMPHYLSKGVNELAASSVEAAVRALEKTVLMLITGIQEIIIFVVHMFTSTYLCLIMLAINSSIGAVTDAAKAIVEAAEKGAKAIFDEINDEKGDFESAINKVTEKISSVPNFFGANIEIPKLRLPSLDKLKDFSVANEVGADLDNLKENIPNFKEVQDAADNVIKKPFALLKVKSQPRAFDEQSLTLHQEAVNSSLTVYEFDRNVFPVPAKEQLTFCSDNPAINNFFDGLVKTIDVTKKIVFGVVLSLVFIFMPIMGYLEWRSHRKTDERARNIIPIAKERSEPAFYIDVSNILGRPYPTGAGLALSDRYRERKPNRATLIRWAVSYVTSPPVLFVLALGIAGLLGVLAQYVVLRKVESETPKLAAEVGEFAGIVVQKLQGASEKWATSTNGVISDTNAELNKELFGWVQTGTTAVNDTLNTFVDEMEKGLDEVFGNGPLKEPIKEVINCLIGLKIAGIQKGLTWAKEHAQIAFPTLPKDTFSVGASDSILPESANAESFLADPGSKATDKITNSLARLTDKWKETLIVEAIINACIIGIWVICVFIALGRLAVGWNSKEKTRGEGGPAPYIMESYPAGKERERSHSPTSTVFEDNTRRFSDDPFRPSGSSPQQPQPSAISQSAFGHERMDRTDKYGYLVDEKR